MLQIHDPHHAFHQASWLSLVGPDAGDFLQRLTTIAVRNLAVGQGSPACFLNAQGKLKGYFWLWRYGEQEFGLEYNGIGEWKNQLLQFIDHFTFGEKMTLTDATPPSGEGLTCRWLLGEPPDAVGALETGQTLALQPLSGAPIRVCHHGSLDYGRPWISAWGRPNELAAWMETLPRRGEHTVEVAQEISAELLDLWRIVAVRPAIEAELRLDDTNPLEAGLVDAITPNKGCYPGQEVIEKIAALGSPPRRLVRLEGTGNPPGLGEAIVNFGSPPLEMGHITSLAVEPGKFTALALVRKLHAQEGIQVQFKKTAGAAARITRVSSYV